DGRGADREAVAGPGCGRRPRRLSGRGQMDRGAALEPPLGVRAGAVRALPAGAPRREYPDAAGGWLRLPGHVSGPLAWVVMKHLLLPFALLLFPAAARAQ